MSYRRLFLIGTSKINAFLSAVSRGVGGVSNRWQELEINKKIAYHLNVRTSNHTALNDATRAYVDLHYDLDWRVFRALNQSAFQVAVLSPSGNMQCDLIAGQGGGAPQHAGVPGLRFTF